MKAIVILFLTVCCLSLPVMSQSKLGNTWITGYSGNRVEFNASTINTFPGIYFPFKYFTGGNSCISDTSGNLILASDGYNIYDKMGSYLDEGDSLIPPYYFTIQDGWSSGSQTSIFLPMDSNKYYFVTPTFSDLRYDDCHNNGGNCYFDLLLYNMIDMNANAGLGKVTQRMIPIMQNANLRKTQMMACKHGNGKDWWLLKQEGDSANVHTFLFTQDSVYDKGVQVFNEPVWGPWDIRGQSTFNNDGSLYATTSHGSSTGLIFIADFDRCHGVLNNPAVIQMPWGSQQDPFDTLAIERLSTGLVFSTNHQFLYVISHWNIYQYDLQDSTWFHVAGLDTSHYWFQGYETAYLGPDNKIYIGNFGGGLKQMSRIDNPDVKGAGCNFCPRCLRLDSLGANAYVGTPPCMPDYGLGAKTCWPLGSGSIEQKAKSLSVYPNPCSGVFTLESSLLNQQENEILVQSISGEKLYSKTVKTTTGKIDLDISHLAAGIYILRVGEFVRKVAKE